MNSNPLAFENKAFCYEQRQASQNNGQNLEGNRSMEKPSAIPSNMVMIDQAQLMELLQAKQILDAQKASAATQGFNSALFISPPRMSKENKTQCTSKDSNTSVDYTGEILPLKNQKPQVSFSGLAMAQSSASEKQHSFENLEMKSEHSVDEQTQGQMLDEDLMRIIDDCDDSNNVSSFELSKINENSKNSLNKSGSSLDSLIQNIQPMEQPEQFRSIFAQDPVWTPPTVTNNIVINNYNAYPQHQPAQQ